VFDKSGSSKNRFFICPQADQKDQSNQDRAPAFQHQ
jgi:hypothetical protein